MRCPSCGALNDIGVDRCPECAAFASEPEEESGLEPTSLCAQAAAPAPLTQPSTLIEFPGVSRSSVPPWRKELSERVREVQEKRAREAALEEAEEQQRAENHSDCSPPQLELLRQAEVVPMNPLVAAALRRIERAHQASNENVDHSPKMYPVAAVAYATETRFRNESRQGPDVTEVIDAIAAGEIENIVSEAEPSQPDKVHNLVVVPSPVDKTEQPKSKPRRMIVDNDPALNYLDSVPTSARVEAASHHNAPVFLRFLGAIVDLMAIVLLGSPFAAVVELTNRNWQDLRVAVAAAICFLVVSFLYLTISTALTGRTLGTRLFSLRIVDARTGLIPTGKQSAGRALVYLATLLTLGLASISALVDREKRTPHDRLTRTAVIAA